MMKNLLLDYIPFEISRDQINESISDNDGRLIVKGVLQRAEAKNQNGRIYPKDTLVREAKKYAKLLTSSTVPNLFRGILFKNSIFLSVSKFFVISVFMNPGLIAFILIFLEPNSLDKDFVKPIIPALEAA